ncbi:MULTISPECIES: ParB/RepB/Spo0J family partition protein [unclassified Sphingomonas]|uniref:ParB/RepB/Spo0J family partition protein n=1 Tax=unclassified Sphingomonas TaxID=196159 RepID=UPI0006F6E26F|nr:MULTISPECIES: ParB/RepB/Spo0J family partition protein [unclassified Sphingomonas]KQM26600.1 chromosome partitioning protein ParB [Sphingomonas sp. Leaf9]KQM43006.1 chromosome partitioning protein ParB [Sphingomonas sp. Leaf11]KQM87024.1 chromosome partitioning protein ParB [Sphingomonas sp. Leaf23]
MSEQAAPRRPRMGGLGRGLSSLLGDPEGEVSTARGATPPSGVRQLPVTALAPLPGQPRRFFDETALDELAESISARGVIQPIVVRPHGKGYQIVAGERRWRAAQRARLHEVPVVVRDFTDAETMEIALVENIQRRDLTAIEEAEGYRRLIDEFGHTQEALANLVAKSRSHVTNLLRLLELPKPIQDMVGDQRLSMGHARALIHVPGAETIAEKVVAKGLSVRDVERMARQARDPEPKRVRTPRDPAMGDGGADGATDADLRALERQLGDVLGLKIQINHGEKGGAITIGYSTLGQLDMVCQRLSGERI